MKYPELTYENLELEEIKSPKINDQRIKDLINEYNQLERKQKKLLDRIEKRQKKKLD